MGQERKGRMRCDEQGDKWENEGKMREELKCHLKREEGEERGDN